MSEEFTMVYLVLEEYEHAKNVVQKISMQKLVGYGQNR